jgi:hypothetical protein
MNPHISKVFILKADGTQQPLIKWQQENAYEVGSARIAKNFWFTEPKFMNDIQDYGRLIVCEPLMKVLDLYRDMKAAPVRINSFNRSRKKQESLIKGGFKAASLSPHEFFLAADCDTDTDTETRLNVAMVKNAAQRLGIKVRIGFEEYMKAKQTFIHVDVCPEYFGPGKVWHQRPHPPQWENPSTW